MKILLYPFALFMSWCCWLLGHVSYLILDLYDNENWINFWFKPYQSGMQLSSQSQDFVGGHGGIWPWSEVVMEEDTLDK